MRAPALMDADGNVVFLPSATKLEFGSRAIRYRQEALTGSVFEYGVGSYYDASITAEMVSSADAERIRDWWRNGTRLSFSPSATMSGANIVVNGTAESALADDQWASTFSRDTNNSYNDDASWFFAGQAAASTFNTAHTLPIDDPWQMYAVRLAMRTHVMSQQVLIGLRCITEVGPAAISIRPENAHRRAQSKLFAPAIVNSQYIDVLKSMTFSYGGTQVIQFWVSSDYSDLPNLNTLQINSVDVTPSSYSRVYLASAITTYAATGTAVGISVAGGTHPYVLSPTTTSSGWQEYVSSIYGYNAPDTAPGTYQFRYGTKFVQLYVSPRTFSGGVWIDNVEIAPATYLSNAVSSLFIANRDDPISKVVNRSAGLFGGTIDLESF